MGRFIIAGLILIALAAPTFAQSVFIEPDQSALFFSAGGATYKEVSSIGVMVGKAANGRADIGLGIGRTFAKGFSQMNVWQAIDLYVIRQKQSGPVLSFAVGESYMLSFHKVGENTIKDSYLTLHGTACRRVDATPDSFLMFSGGLLWTREKKHEITTLDPHAGLTYGHTDVEGRVFAVGLGVVIPNEGIQVGIQVSVSFPKND